MLHSDFYAALAPNNPLGDFRQPRANEVVALSFRAAAGFAAWCMSLLHGFNDCQTAFRSRKGIPFGHRRSC